MNCRACDGSSIKVLRTTTVGGEVRRSRECTHCGERWTTTELHDQDVGLLRSAMALVESAKSFFKEIGNGPSTHR